MPSQKSLQTASSQLSFAYANRGEDDCKQLEVRRLGGRGASWDFPRAGSQRQPFYLLVGASGSSGPGCPATPRPVGAVPEAPHHRAGSGTPVPCWG